MPLPFPKVQLFGTFSDARGNPDANGTLTMQLTADAQVTSPAFGRGIGQLCSGRTVTISLDSDGAIVESPAQYVMATDWLQPAGLQYIVTVYSAEGQQVFGPKLFSIPLGNQTFDFNTDYSSALYSDDFNRADENPLAAPWIAVNTGSGSPFPSLELVSDAVQPTGLDEQAVMFYNETVTSDQFSQVTVASLPSGVDYFVGVVVRASYFDGNYYALFASDGYVELYKSVDEGAGAVETLITYSLQAVGNGDVLKLTAVGNVLTGYVNGTQVLQATDSDISSGLAGISISVLTGGTLSDATADNWSGGSV